MSAKLLIYDDIETALKTLTTDSQPDINTIEIWNNQPLNEKQERSVNYPAVYVQFNQTTWNRTHVAGSNAGASGATGQTEEQQGSLTITLHQVFSKLELTTQAFKDNDIIIDKIYFVIQNLQGSNLTNYTPLLRVSDEQDIDHERVIDEQVTFLVNSIVQPGQGINFVQVSGGTIDVSTIPIT